MVISNVEIILGITGLSFASIVVYFAFKLENKNNNKLMQEIRAIRELLEKLNNKTKEL